jgi:hypothetical protein
MTRIFCDLAEVFSYVNHNKLLSIYLIRQTQRFRIIGGFIILLL